MNKTTSASRAPNLIPLSFFGIYCIVCAFVLPTFAYHFLESLMCAVAVLVCMAFGYFLQAGVSAAMRSPREIESRAYESEIKYFKKRTAIPVWIITGLLSYLVSIGVDLILLERSKIPTYSYDPDSLLPEIIAVIFFVTVALGSFVWFFPFSRIMTGKGLYAGLTVMFIIFVLHSTMKSPATVSVGICLLGYAFCAMIAANQYALGRTYRGTVVSFMTPQTRKYNLLLSFGLVAVFLALLFFAYLIVNGLRVTVLFLVATVLRAMDNNDVGYTEDEEASIFASVSKFVFGREQASHSINYWLYIIFVIFVILFIAAVITRRRPEFKRFIAWLKGLIVALFEFFWLPIRDFKNSSEEYFTNYIDEERKLQKDERRARRPEDSVSRMTWRDFNAILRSKETSEEKYRFAYSAFVTQLRRMPLFIKRSDTPRKICERLTAGGKIASKGEIERITDAFEQIEFADRPADRKTDEAMQTLCDKIRENM